MGGAAAGRQRRPRAAIFVLGLCLNSPHILQLIDPLLPSPYHSDRATRYISRADAANRPSYSREL